MKRFLTFIIALVYINNAYSQTPTWSGEIAGLVYKNCTSCHHTGGIAPFSLMSYQQTFNNRFRVRSSVNTAYMPPWPPDNTYRKHAFSRALSEADIKKFDQWIEGGAPSGDLTKAPIAPVYDNLGFIKSPDLTITIPKYTISSSVDEYRCFPDSTRLTKDMWMTALECIPGDPEIVHHVLIFRDKGVKSFSLDSKQEGPGYICFGGAGTNDAELLAAWVPGQGAFSLPKGFGMKIPAKSNIIIQIHYPAGAKGKSDQTKVKFKLTDQPQRETMLLPALNHEISLTNGPLVIPANTVKTFNQRFPLLATVSVLGVAPHMHLIGTSIKTWALGNDLKEIPLINIPKWDFHWQGIYMFPKIQKLSAGSFLYSEAKYDNTTANHHNPNDPPKEVRVGEATTDEMMLTYFLFTLYQPGDENIVIDTLANFSTDIKQIELNKKEIYLIPNPISNQSDFHLRFNADAKDRVRIEIFDIQGRKQYQSEHQYANKDFIDLKISTSNLAKGVYIVKAQGNTWLSSRKMMVQ